MPIENKQGHPFNGYEGSYIILTCNSLPFPFKPPNYATSGWTYEEYERENKAFEGRCKITELKKSHDNSKGKAAFPFTAE